MTEAIRQLELQLDTFDADAQTDLRSKIDTLAALAKELRYQDTERSAVYSQQSIDLSYSEEFAPLGYEKGIAAGMLSLSIHNYLIGHYHQALAELIEARRFAEPTGDIPLQAEILLNLAHNYMMLGDSPMAVDYALKAVEKCGKAGLRLEQADAYNKLGIIQGKLGDLAQSLDALLMSLALYREIDNTAGEAILLNDIAVTQKSLHDFDNALASAHRSLVLASENKLDLLEANSLCTIGEIYLAQGSVDQALAFFQNGIAYSRRLDFKYVEMYALLCSGQAYLQSDRVDQALTALLAAVDIAQVAETKSELSQCYMHLSEAYKRQGDFATALLYHERYHAVYQTVFNEESDRRVKNLQIAHDTESAQKEAEIFRLKNAELEQEIIRRQQSERERLEIALEQERIQILANFITQASHEFRTPLSVIKINAYLLKQVSDAEKQAQRTRAIEEQVGHITDLVNNMVTLSRLDGGVKEGNTESVDLNEMMQSAYRAFTTLGQAKTHKTKLALSQESLSLRGSSASLRQAVDYILENAYRYTPEGGTITVQTERLDQYAVIKIEDTGVGISQEALPHIFERFYRVDVAGTMRGFGLGLSIAKAMIDRHGGRIDVESRLGQGSVFSIWLPTAPKLMTAS